MLVLSISSSQQIAWKLHGKTHNLTRKLRFEYDDALSKVDILVMPTLPWVAKKLLVRQHLLLMSFPRLLIVVIAPGCAPFSALQRLLRLGN